MTTPLSPLTIFSIVVGLLVALPSIMGFFSRNKFDVRGKTVLLTGASEGMGLNVAKQLAQKGASIVIVSRNVEKLKAALEQIKTSAANPSQRFKYISADVSEEDGAEKVIKEVITWNNGQAPDVVWCIAGSATPGLFLDTSKSVMRQQMDTNFWSCADMAHAILPIWLAPENVGKGNTRHLVFTSSVVAFYPVAGYAPYAPSKAAIKSLSDCLVQEVLLYGDDVKVHTVFPGTIQSPGLERENQTKPEITHKLEESDPVQTPEVVAAKSIKGLENGEYLVTVSWLGTVMRACAWGGSSRNNWILDTIVTWIASIAWIIVGPILDGEVKTYKKKNGHPSTYVKRS